MMKQIGEIGRLYQVSNRMLRYYEDRGILTSIRMDNNYRYYNEKQEMRIQQILLLKELEFTTTEIESVFSMSSTFEITKLLLSKQKKLLDRIENLERLNIIINNFIYLLDTTKNPIFDSLVLSLQQPNRQLKGEINMNKQDVRIIQLPAMKVASFKVISETPEDDVAKLVDTFVKEHKLVGFRHFGFNNPNPKEGNPMYGYEMWVTVEKDYPNVKIKKIKGGLYASVSSYMPNIGTRWNNLAKYIQNCDEYDIDFEEEEQFGVAEHQWLEECTNYNHFFNPSIPFTEKQLDLLLPIKKA